ncbi:M17 family metallopeptidase [Deinococcus arenicola]|uniref:Leucyl aminopeptidase family protein n=1 Tax=Deinococcus arenicola TaxID=2994950 RepID=A0ABU4DQ13_9DEIO|nr:leucyl aminopeptidase family protein [Deinococcus sp. ZS9-10]MDV6374521.1 leucyl aminopeptidase family protein [Deinococcus sp. ZS9-10]
MDHHTAWAGACFTPGMQLVDLLERADLSLTFAEMGAARTGEDWPERLYPERLYPERLARDLEAGEVRLILRGEDGDTALALPPENAQDARELGAALAQLARELKAQTVNVTATDHAAALASAALAAGWQDRRYKGGDHQKAEVQLHVEGLDANASARIRGMAAGLTFARELVSAPANHLNPASMAREAQTLASHGVEVEVWDGPTIEARGMGLLAAVAAGSVTGPRLIRLTLPAHGEPSRIVALVGKGITFDTGGYSLKTAAGMYGMKNDMGGAGAVLGAIRALAELRGSIPEGTEVRAYVAAAENMVGPLAMRPGDVYRAANGKTVEITNTDAEGRLVLADALTVACDEGATEVVDLATLTGVKVAALGNDMAALFCSDRELAARLTAGAEAAGELLWELPLHQPYLKSYRKNTIADLKNSDMVPAGGSIKAALFLQQFVTRPWAHLDIAGNAAREDVATGWGVATLVEYVLGAETKG